MSSTHLLLVCGGRYFSDEELMLEWLSKLQPSAVIHGGASGADNQAGSVARAMGIPVTVYPANWKKYGRSAGPRRNQEMLEALRDAALAGWTVKVLAMPGGKGTADMVRRATEARFEVVGPGVEQQKESGHGV
ncbi:MAG: SLOG family protein [Candidatus Neomarinimicrobiota bacterium]|jgi:hypothetical protein